MGSSVTSQLLVGSQGFYPWSCQIFLGYKARRGNPSPSSAAASLTRMKRHWLANFWCSWMVEKTDSTRQLKTRRNLQGQSVGGGTGTAREPQPQFYLHSQPEHPSHDLHRSWQSHWGHILPLDGCMETLGSPGAAVGLGASSAAALQLLN